MDQLSYGSDLGKDVRIQYIDALRRGKDSTEATNQLIADYEPSLFDEEDAPRFWFALADVQWNLGRLEETVKHHALVYIEKELECAKLPTSDAVCIDIPINVLTMLKQKLQNRGRQAQAAMGDLYNGTGGDAQKGIYRLSAKEPASP